MATRCQCFIICGLFSASTQRGSAEQTGIQKIILSKHQDMLAEVLKEHM